MTAATLIVGCATGRKTEGGWLGIGASAPRAYYVGVARAKLYRAPDVSSEVVGELAMHDGVLRYEVKGEFSYVKAEQGGRSGWLQSAKLIDDLPRQTTRAEKPASAAPVSAPDAGEPTEKPEGETTEPEAPHPPEKSVFDPY